VSPSRVSRLADEFVARGWLERAASPHDGRLSLVRLTDTGRTTLAAMEQTLAGALHRHFLNALDARQLNTLISICAPSAHPTADPRSLLAAGAGPI
jgi:DNA-binding MarR family transcriptional regulator